MKSLLTYLFILLFTSILAIPSANAEFKKGQVAFLQFDQDEVQFILDQLFTKAQEADVTASRKANPNSQLKVGDQIVNPNLAGYKMGTFSFGDSVTKKLDNTAWSNLAIAKILVETGVPVYMIIDNMHNHINSKVASYLLSLSGPNGAKVHLGLYDHQKLADVEHEGQEFKTLTLRMHSKTRIFLMKDGHDVAVSGGRNQEDAHYAVGFWNRLNKGLLAPEPKYQYRDRGVAIRDLGPDGPVQTDNETYDYIWSQGGHVTQVTSQNAAAILGSLDKYDDADPREQVGRYEVMIKAYAKRPPTAYQAKRSETIQLLDSNIEVVSDRESGTEDKPTTQTIVERLNDLDAGDALYFSSPYISFTPKEIVGIKAAIARGAHVIVPTVKPSVNDEGIEAENYNRLMKDYLASGITFFEYQYDLHQKMVVVVRGEGSKKINLASVQSFNGDSDSGHQNLEHMVWFDNPTQVARVLQDIHGMMILSEPRTNGAPESILSAHASRMARCLQAMERAATPIIKLVL